MEGMGFPLENVHFAAHFKANVTNGEGRYQLKLHKLLLYTTQGRTEIQSS